METRYLASILAIATATTILGSLFVPAQSISWQNAYAQKGIGNSLGNGPAVMGQGALQGGHLAGHISSVQLGNDSKPAWLQSGIWVMRQLSNASGQNPNVQLVALFSMVMPDGTALHTHKVSNFKATSVSAEGNNTTIEGTATVVMKGNPVSDVPVKVEVFNNTVVQIWIGPDKIDGHFGTGPIYGLVSTQSRERLHSMAGGGGPPTS